MAYTPTTWKTGDLITAEKMNKLEQGVQNEQAGPAGPSYTLPAANLTTLGGVKQAAAVADATTAPTKEYDTRGDFGNLKNRPGDYRSGL